MAFKKNIFGKSALLLICLLSSRGIAVSTLPFEAFDRTFGLEASLKAKVAGLGMRTKTIDYSKTSNLATRSQKISRGYQIAKDQWINDFNKSFSAQEIEYLKTVLNHDLFLRLTKFQKNFNLSKETENKIIEDFKKK